MKVKAREGILVPFEQKAGYIGEEPIDIALSTYYQRRIEDGDLIVVEEPTSAKEKGENA